MSPYEDPTIEQLLEISIQLKEDEMKIKHYVALFKEWLKYQGHLPQDIDEHLISNFIRLCKMDLRKAKVKFESCVISTVKHAQVYELEDVTESFFSCQNAHRMILPLPKMTADGSRVMLCHENDPTAKNFDLPNILRYLIMLATYTLIEDTNAGLKAIVDFRNTSLQHAKHIDVKLLTDAIEVITEAFPFRLRGCYVINLPSFLQTLFQWALTLLPEKIRKRVVILENPEDILKHFPKEMLPEDYYGTEISTEVLGEKWKEHLLKNTAWFQKLQKLKLKGPVPKTKQCNNVEMEGSFRGLCID